MRLPIINNVSRSESNWKGSLKMKISKGIQPSVPIRDIQSVNSCCQDDDTLDSIIECANAIDKERARRQGEGWVCDFPTNTPSGTCMNCTRDRVRDRPSRLVDIPGLPLSSVNVVRAFSSL